MCVCLLLVRAKAKIKRNKYGATRSAGDYRRKVQLARLCAVRGAARRRDTSVTKVPSQNPPMLGSQCRALVLVALLGGGNCFSLSRSALSQSVCGKAGSQRALRVNLLSCPCRRYKGASASPSPRSRVRPYPQSVPWLLISVSRARA